MLLQKAMRYYRLWIYSCNAVLLLGVVVFAVTAGSVLSDSRSSFVPVPMYHPTFIYAYLALVAQGGLLQAVGCYGALRLNERWLNIYWMSMLVLLVGDILVGCVWIFLFSSITHHMPAGLWARLRDDYGYDQRYTAAWNNLQQELRCCGVYGPRDYNDTRWSQSPHINATAIYVLAVTGGVATLPLLPASCSSDGRSSLHHSSSPITSTTARGASSIANNFDEAAVHRASSTTVNVTSYFAFFASSTHAPYVSSPPTTWTSSGGSHPSSPTTKSAPSSFPAPLTPSSGQQQTPTSRLSDGVSRQGCARLLQEWLQHCADVLFVLGYCVIAFLKLCFLGILRYEIKEMIQKIKMLNSATEDAQPAYPELMVLGITTPSSGNGSNGGGGGGGVGSNNVNHHGDHKDSLLHNHVNSYDSSNHHHHHTGLGDPVTNHLLDKKNAGSNGNNNDLELTELTRNMAS